eukprot:TCALIF_06578-PA protein Name:"Similar to THAP9 DNA transposase THAP9 (Homo sapiens)" AED:0.31 eAED:0.31 QI:0/0/0/1/1/1/2/0/434
MLADYRRIVWPGIGVIKWKHIEDLHALQEEHSLRLGNKLTAKHVSFRKSKMKVSLALQVMSNSVAVALRWAHANEIPGFKEKDVLATCEFLELHDKLFDALNSRAKTACGLKAPLTPENVQTGPLGFIACIYSIRRLVQLMESGELKLNCLRCYKLIQDHLENFSAAIRQRNGWSYNPTPQQFRFAFRQLLCHAGKGVIHAKNANCIAQDETVMLTVANIASCSQIIARMMTPEASQIQFVLEDTNSTVTDKTGHVNGCVASDCRVCASSIAYIAGFFAFSLQDHIHCSLCKLSLCHSEMDPCPDTTLISFKDYCPDDPEKGLKIPSGSLCRLLFLCEKVFRRNSSNLGKLDINRKLLVEELTEVNLSTTFPSLHNHALETSDGIDNHYITIVHLICRKYLVLRTKKLLKDIHNQGKVGRDGNAIHRSQIFHNA